MDIKELIDSGEEYNIKFADVLISADKKRYGKISARKKNNKYIVDAFNITGSYHIDGSGYYQYTIEEYFIRIKSVYDEEIGITIPKNPTIKMLMVPAGWTISMREELIKVLNSLS